MAGALSAPGVEGGPRATTRRVVRAGGSAPASPGARVALPTPTRHASFVQCSKGQVVFVGAIRSPRVVCGQPGVWRGALRQDVFISVVRWSVCVCTALQTNDSLVATVCMFAAMHVHGLASRTLSVSESRARARLAQQRNHARRAGKESAGAVFSAGAVSAAAAACYRKCGTSSSPLRKAMSATASHVTKVNRHAHAQAAHTMHKHTHAHAHAHARAGTGTHQRVHRHTTPKSQSPPPPHMVACPDLACPRPSRRGTPANVCGAAQHPPLLLMHTHEAHHRSLTAQHQGQANTVPAAPDTSCGCHTTPTTNIIKTWRQHHLHSLDCCARVPPPPRRRASCGSTAAAASHEPQAAASSCWWRPSSNGVL
jgi:hypothetical protein